MTASRISRSPNLSEILKLIKMYIQFNPGCTARDIALMFTREDYRLHHQLTVKTIRYLIKTYAGNGRYSWFNIIIDGKNPMRFYSPINKVWFEEEI